MTLTSGHDNFKGSPEAGSSLPSESILIRLAKSAGVDRASGFAILARFWQLLTGPVTQILITFCLTTSGQDYYYAFNSMLGMQIFWSLDCMRC